MNARSSSNSRLQWETETGRSPEFWQQVERDRRFRDCSYAEDLRWSGDGRDRRCARPCSRKLVAPALCGTRHVSTVAVAAPPLARTARTGRMPKIMNSRKSGCRRIAGGDAIIAVAHDQDFAARRRCTRCRFVDPCRFKRRALRALASEMDSRSTAQPSPTIGSQKLFTRRVRTHGTIQRIAWRRGKRHVTCSKPRPSIAALLACAAAAARRSL